MTTMGDGGTVKAKAAGLKFGSPEWRAKFVKGSKAAAAPKVAAKGAVKKKVLTTKTRKALPAGAFALPNRRYPIHDKAHARNALARVAQNGTPAEQAIVRRKVKARFPGIDKA